MNIQKVNYAPPTAAFILRAPATITDFVVHHSAGPTSQTPLEIDSFERENGDIYMPYTWLITPDGSVYDGRPITALSAATYGRNPQSVAVCVIGNFQSDDPGYTGMPTQQQLISLKNLCLWAHRTIPTIERTYAHGDVAQLFYPDDPDDYATACCGDVLRKMLPGMREQVLLELQHA